MPWRQLGVRALSEWSEIRHIVKNDMSILSLMLLLMQRPSTVSVAYGRNHCILGKPLEDLQAPIL